VSLFGISFIQVVLSLAFGEFFGEFDAMKGAGVGVDTNWREEVLVAMGLIAAGVGVGVGVVVVVAGVGVVVVMVVGGVVVAAVVRAGVGTIVTSLVSALVLNPGDVLRVVAGDDGLDPLKL